MIYNEIGTRVRAAICETPGYEWTGDIENAKLPLEALAYALDVDALVNLAHSKKKEGRIIIAFLSEEYKATGSVWLEKINTIGLMNYVLVSTDEITSLALSESKIPHCIARVHYTTPSGNYQSKSGFSAKGVSITALKYPVVLALVQSGLDVLLCDIDALLLGNPFMHIESETDIAFQRVAYFPRWIVMQWGFAACSGFVYFRSNAAVIGFVKDCILMNKLVISDQFSLNLSLLKSNVQWDFVTEARLEDNDTSGLHQEFLRMAGIGIRGKAIRPSLNIMALPHNTFWRHEWVPLQGEKIIVAHPNSPKCDDGKIETFRLRGFI